MSKQSQVRAELRAVMESRPCLAALDEQIERTEGRRPGASERLFRFAGVAILSAPVYFPVEFQQIPAPEKRSPETWREVV